MDALEVIGSPSRWRIMELLSHGEKSAGELAEELGISNQGALKHLAVLMEDGLVREARPSGGRKVIYSLRTSVYLFRKEDAGGELVVYHRGRARTAGLPPEAEFRASRLLKRLKLLLEKPD
ncbi:MAG TPA: metalloregulator ArsR/SmtB family transcription factor [Conexivisphaerales archaeon]|nr:metalloregulator ArsR/SmtB family transcription factor [Conexivisphaerales archaeon]